MAKALTIGISPDRAGTLSGNRKQPRAIRIDSAAANIRQSLPSPGAVRDIRQPVSAQPIRAQATGAQMNTLPCVASLTAESEIPAVPANKTALTSGKVAA